MASTLAKVLWINLDRRTDRAELQRARLEHAGLEDFSERFSAVEGAEVDFSQIPQSVLTHAGRRQAQHGPDFVLGRVLTPGAVGLWLSWYEIMYRIIEEAAAEDCYLMLEDDAEYTDQLGPDIFGLLDALDTADPGWHACACGFIRSKSRSRELPGSELLRAPTKLCGATAILVHGADGARELLENLFPVDADQQLDLKITLTLHDPQSTLRFYSSKVPLCTAPLSEAGDTDIQRIPLEKQQEMKEEASKRHEMGDLIAAPPALRTNHASKNQHVLPKAMARGQGKDLETWCHGLRCVWPSRHVAIPLPTAVAPAAMAPTERQLQLEELRLMDKGVPELRHLHGELAMKMQQLRSRDGNMKQLEKDRQELQRRLEDAVEARDYILTHALPYEPRSCSATRKALLLRHVPNGDSDKRALQHFGRGRRRVMIFGPYHSCTNAMAKELERHFDVEILNDWHTCKADRLWKHRANHRSPESLAPDVFCVLMAKEPHFWLQSCGRELRNFFEIRPVGPQRRELPAQELWQLLKSIEHDGILYENAMDLWNDTMHSYMDDSVYPPEQAVIVRCEDFLFSFQRVMESLECLGALTRKAAFTPLPERAKGHKECRSRDEALAFYSNPKNQKSAFSSDQLTLIRYALDLTAMSQLGYDQADAVQRWCQP